MLLLPKDFKGKYTIPNFGDVNPLSNKLGSDDFVSTILKNEVKQELISLLGYPLYKIIEDNLSDNFNERFLPNTEQRIVDLVEGKDDYFGLVNGFVDFTYYHYLRETNSDLTGVGVKTTKSKTGVKFTAREKAVYSYNKYIKFVYGEVSGGSYPKVVQNVNGISIDYFRQTNFNSVYDFLIKNKDYYPELILGNKKTNLLNNFEI